MGMGAAALMVPPCLAALSSCSKEEDTFPAPPTNVDFTIEVSNGALSVNGGFDVRNGIIIGRTIAGEFLAVSAACTHQGTTLQYVGASNSFHCPNHGSNFTSAGMASNGPASKPLVVYNTSLTGSTLRIFS